MARKALIVFTVALMTLFAVAAYCGTTGIISGTVTDSATGDKLAGVNIIVEGTNLTTVTDKNGYYVITNVPPGDYNVTAGLVGYSDALANISIIMDVTIPLDFAMEQAVAQEEEVVVTESRPMVRHDVIPTMYVIENTQEAMIRTTPGMMFQAPGVVMTQPGVVPDEYGYPHIRGGRENQIGWMIDGIPVTETILNGFGTNLVTLGMDKMEIFVGGYRPEYGNAVSGVLNQVVKTGRTAPGFMTEALTGDLSFKGFHSEIGGATQKGLDYYAGAYLWHSGFEGVGSNEVDSSDMIGKFSYPLGNKDTATLLISNGSAQYKYPTSHTITFDDGMEINEQAGDHSHQSHELIGLTLNHKIDAKSFFTLRPYYFRSRGQVDAIKLTDIEDPACPYWWEDVESANTGLMLDYTNQLSEKHLLKAGLLRIASNNRYWGRVPLMDYPGVDGTYEYQANTDLTQTGLYFQDQYKVNNRWILEGGLRYDRASYDREISSDYSVSQWSPRLGASYVVNPRTNLRFSYGRMIEFVPTRHVERNWIDPIPGGYAAWYYPADGDPLRPERSTQIDFGWERQVSDNYSIKATIFSRKFVDMLQSYMTPSYEVVYENLGEGKCKGLELQFKRKATNNWSGWLSYTWSKAKAEGNSFSDEVTPGTSYFVNWDQRHTAVLVMNYDNKPWNCSLMAEYGSGLPYGTDNSERVGSHTVFNVNIRRDVKGNLLPPGVVQLSIANLLNSGATLSRDTNGNEITRFAPKFIGISYIRSY